MMTAGVIVLQNLIKLLFAAWRSLSFEPTSKATLQTMRLWEWLRNSFYSGESLPGGVGGKVSN
jgi:hypothetical protein